MTDLNAETMASNIADGWITYIVGPNHFQNALLAAYIETHSKGNSTVLSSITAIGKKHQATFSGQAAVLYDCFGTNANKFSAILQEELQQLPPEFILALFNMERCAGLEKKALELGVQGFFYQDDTVETLLKGLAVIFGGEFWVSRHDLAEIVLENSFGQRRMQVACNVYPHDLTCREVEILGLLTLGATNETISNKLFISPNTVRTHLNHIFKKIQVTNRLEASNWAVKSIFGRKYEYPVA